MQLIEGGGDEPWGGIIRRSMSMKNTICEKMMWSAMTPAIFKYIAVHCIDTDTSRVKKVSRKNFKDMLARTPDIGGFMKNPLRICLSGGIIWMAFQRAPNLRCSALPLCRIFAALSHSPRCTVYGEACTGIKIWRRKLFHLFPNSHTGEKIFHV